MTQTIGAESSSGVFPHWLVGGGLGSAGPALGTNMRPLPLGDLRGAGLLLWKLRAPRASLLRGRSPLLPTLPLKMPKSKGKVIDAHLLTGRGLKNLYGISKPLQTEGHKPVLLTVSWSECLRLGNAIPPLGQPRAPNGRGRMDRSGLLAACHGLLLRPPGMCVPLFPHGQLPSPWGKPKFQAQPLGWLCGRWLRACV